MGITDDHDILTDQGWINISHLTKDHFVATLNPLTKVLEFNKPFILYNYTNISPMYNIVDDNIDLCMTMAHPLYASPNNTKWSLTNGSYLSNQTTPFYLTSNLQNKATTISTYQFANGPSLTMNKWLQFMGLFLRFGKITNTTTQLISINYVSTNSLSYIITNINSELTDGSQFKLISHSIVDGVSVTIVKIPSYALADLMALNGIVPAWCYRLGGAQLNILQVNGIVPDTKLPNGIYSTKNKALIDSLQIIYLLANKPRIIQPSTDGSYSLVTQSQPSIASQFISSLVGYVYEMSVPNFIFMARRRNKPVFI
jgi:hypothetical protein